MNYEKEVNDRVLWIKEVLKKTGAKGVVLGNSGGKDCSLVEILCRKATPNVLSVIMPCESSQNYGQDRKHAYLVAETFDIPTVEVDITNAKKELRKVIEPIAGNEVPMAYNNINPRLRMSVIYAIGQAKGYLVAGTGNASETYMGYFTKWGDGGYDFNPINDLLVEDVFGMLKYLGCPEEIITKKPSAGLYEGQTDEQEMGVSYEEIDKFIKTGKSEFADKIMSAHKKTEHKRVPPLKYSDK